MKGLGWLVLAGAGLLLLSKLAKKPEQEGEETIISKEAIAQLPESARPIQGDLEQYAGKIGETPVMFMPEKVGGWVAIVEGYPVLHKTFEEYQTTLSKIATGDLSASAL